MKSYLTVDAYIDGNVQWHDELLLLRRLLTSTELTECVKWGAPCYTINGKNVVGIGAFKSYVGLWFHQGAFLKDNANVLLNANEGVTKGLRQWRFESLKDIDETLVLKYVDEAIQNQKAGKEIKIQKNKPLMIDPILEDALQKDEVLRSHFDTFTLSKKREFTEHISSAKQEKTKLSRLEKIIPMIKSNIGLNDKYRNC